MLLHFLFGFVQKHQNHSQNNNTLLIWSASFPMYKMRLSQGFRKIFINEIYPCMKTRECVMRQLSKFIWLMMKRTECNKQQQNFPTTTYGDIFARRIKKKLGQNASFVARITKLERYWIPKITTFYARLFKRSQKKNVRHLRIHRKY